MGISVQTAMTDIADAIRTKTGNTATLSLAEMPSEILSISGGEVESLEDALIERTLTTYVNNRVETIGAGAFSFFNGLTSVSMLHCTFIGNKAFNQCPSLETVNMPSVTNIGVDSFRGCPKLKYVEFNSLIRIEGAAFVDCPDLQALIIRTPTMCVLNAANVFTRSAIANKTGFVYVPDDLVDTYKAGTNWAAHASQIKGLSELEVGA